MLELHDDIVALGAQSRFIAERGCERLVHLFQFGALGSLARHDPVHLAQRPVEVLC